METKKNQQKSKWRIIPSITLLIIIAAVLMLCPGCSSPEEPQEAVTVSTLERIINVSELSTFTAVYNGIAKVSSDETPDNINYYVSYEANVDAGIDFEKIVIDLDAVSKSINIVLPDVYITDIEVKIESLEFIFYNEDSNSSTVTQEAFIACEADAKTECENQAAIYDLAKKNAVNVLTALLKPFVNQLDNAYTLTIN